MLHDRNQAGKCSERCSGMKIGMVPLLSESADFIKGHSVPNSFWVILLVICFSECVRTLLALGLVSREYLAFLFSTKVSLSLEVQQLGTKICEF